MAETETHENELSGQVEFTKKPSPAKQGIPITPLLVGCLALVGLFLCGLFSLIILYFISFTPQEGEQDQWLALCDEYMQTMAAKDISAVYLLFARAARRDFSKGEIRDWVEGPLFATIDGYSSLEIEAWEINYDFQLGRSVNLAGPISYQGDYEGYFDALLIKEDDRWKLFWFNVTAPPEKFNDYAKKNSAKPIPFSDFRPEKSQPSKESSGGELAQVRH